VGKFGRHYIWRTDYFGVLVILNLAIHSPHAMFLKIMRVLRLIDRCCLGLSERLLAVADLEV